MAFDRKRRIKLPAITGAIPFALFAIGACFANERDQILPLLGAGVFIGLILFAVIAMSKPQKDDE